MGKGIPVSVVGVVHVVGKTVETPFLTVPGIVTSSVYTDGDAFGTSFSFDGVPKSGVIHTAILLDKDDEGVELDLVLFRAAFSPTADHDPFAVSDSDMERILGVVTFSVFKNFANNQVSTPAGIGLTYVSPEGRFFCQCAIRGAPNIAAGNEPKLRLLILSDDED